MSNKAIAYAEDELGAHKTYNDALAAQRDLDIALVDLDEGQDAKRSLVDQIADHEAMILGVERGKHSEQSATWLEGHMKEVRRTDETLRKLREELNDAEAKISGSQMDREAAKARVQIYSSRLIELGGYFQYLAAVKLAANNTAKTTTPETPTSPVTPT